MKAFLPALILLLTVTAVHAQQTALDSAFGVNGIVRIDSPVFLKNNKIALQPDGKIVMAGTYFYYLPNFDLVYSMRMMRFMPDGSRDPAFGGTGMIFKLLEKNAAIAGLSIQPDGRILVTGSSGFLERYLPDGTPDSTFNDSGRVVLGFLGTYDGIAASALQPDGKIIMTGSFLQQYVLLYRLQANGHPDSAFGYYGLFTTALDSSAFCDGNDIAVQPDGKILVAANAAFPGPPADYRSAVIRYTEDGYLDGSFNNGKGYLTFSMPGQASGSAGSVSLRQDGRIIIGGIVFYPPAGVNSRGSSYLVRLTAGGTIDSSFHGNGRLVAGLLDSSSSQLWVQPIVKLQPDKKILLSLTGIGPSGNRMFSLYRFNEDGAPDNSFGTSGRLLTDITPNQDVPHDMAVQPDGKIIISGISDMDDHWPQSLHSAPTMVRYLPNIRVGIPAVSAAISGVTVFPNPARDKITIVYTLSREQEIRVSLMDMSGRLVRQLAGPAILHKGSQMAVLPLGSALPPGIYFVVISGEEERRQVKINIGL